MHAGERALSEAQALACDEKQERCLQEACVAPMNIQVWALHSPAQMQQEFLTLTIQSPCNKGVTTGKKM